MSMHADRLEQEVAAREQRATSVRSYDSRSSTGGHRDRDGDRRSSSRRHHDDDRDRDGRRSSRRYDEDDERRERSSRDRPRTRRVEIEDQELAGEEEEEAAQDERRHRRRPSSTQDVNHDLPDDRLDADLVRSTRTRTRSRSRERSARVEDGAGERRRHQRDRTPPPVGVDDDYREPKRRRSRSRDPYDRPPPASHRDPYYDNDYYRRDDRRGSPRRRSPPPRNRDPYYDDRRRRPPPTDDRSPPRRRGSPSYEEDSRRRRRSMSPALTEEEREMRSVFVSQLSARVGDRELGIFFDQQAGKVREARVIVDRISRRSKGVGYVEFVELETVQKALTLTGTKLLGIPIVVQYTEAEKNRQAREPGSAPPPAHAPSPANSLYVGSLNFALTEEDVRQVFQPFGEVTGVDLHRDAITNKSKGYAFVQFKEVKDAQQALEKMNNFVLAGREIKVGLVGDRQIPMNRGETQLEREDAPALNNISRMELMQKLARSDNPVPDISKPDLVRNAIPQATTRNVMMGNAFNPEEETERDWDLELRDDVKIECENSYGPVTEIFILKESKGEIYLRFATMDAAVKAVAGLNGRFFGGHQITATHTSDQLFDAKK